MDKFPETILKLIKSYQFLFLELLQSEVDGNQGKPIMTFMLENFNPLTNLLFFDPVEGVLVSVSLAKGMNLF